MTDTVAVGFLDDGNWSACFGLSYRDVVVNDLTGPRRIVSELRQFTGTGGIVTGRNRIAHLFLDQTDADWLWMVDTDMGFGADALECLLAAADPGSVPVVGGLAFAIKAVGAGASHSQRFVLLPTIYGFRPADDVGPAGFSPAQDYPRDQVVAAHGTGAACLLVHRGVLERLRKTYGDTWFDPVIEPSNGGRQVFSEDLSFCIRLLWQQIPLHVHTGVKTVHHKGGLYLSEALFDQQRLIDRGGE